MPLYIYGSKILLYIYLFIYFLRRSRLVYLIHAESLLVQKRETLRGRKTSSFFSGPYAVLLLSDGVASAKHYICDYIILS